MHLLVIEDERALCETIVRSLRRLAYSVDYCYDGEKALALLGVERYDLVLLDLNLPKKDGMTVLRTLRQTDRETRVLILSARGEVEDKVEGLDAGANDYLAKPFHLAELEARIRSLTLRQFTQQDVLLSCGDLTFEDGGNPVEQNRLMAALDPVLCDAYGCSLLDIPVESVPYITTAAGLGAGCCDLSQARIAVWQEEEGAADFRVISKTPESIPDAEREKPGEGFRRVMKLAEKTREVESCSACYGYLLPALRMLEEEGLLDQLKEKVCIGQGFRGKSGELGVGNCTRAFRHTLAGCPPTENQMYEFLKAYLKKM